MASLVDEQHEWNAVRVRQTFLDYFKKNGHTFGTGAGELRPLSMTLIRRSAFFVRGAIGGSDFALHQCWHEPVQIYLLRNS